MRSLRSATWTSGEPVSPSWVLYVLMISVLRSLVNATCRPPRTAQERKPAPDRRIRLGPLSGQCPPDPDDGSMQLNCLAVKTYYLILRPSDGATSERRAIFGRRLWLAGDSVQLPALSGGRRRGEGVMRYAVRQMFIAIVCLCPAVLLAQTADELVHDG